MQIMQYNVWKGARTRRIDSNLESELKEMLTFTISFLGQLIRTRDSVLVRTPELLGKKGRDSAHVGHSHVIIVWFCTVTPTFFLRLFYAVQRSGRFCEEIPGLYELFFSL